MNLSVEPAESGRAYVVRLGAETVGVLRFSLPVEPETGWQPGEEYAFAGRAGALGLTIRVFEDVDVVSLIITVDAAPGEAIEVPPVVCELELGRNRAGWGSATGADGFVLLPSTLNDGVVPALSLRRGKLLDLSGELVFAPEPEMPTLFDDDPPGRPGTARFAVEPASELAGGRRAQTVLRFACFNSFEAAVEALTRGPVAEPAWGVGGPVVIDAPDEALVVPAGLLVSVEQEQGGQIEASVVNGPPGHHFAHLLGARGSHLVRLSFAPPAKEALVGSSEQIVAVEPRHATSAQAFVVSQCLAEKLAPEPERYLDWCEQEDWLAREDLLGVAAAANLAVVSRDVALYRDAWGTLPLVPVRFGFGLVAMRLHIAGFNLLGGPPAGLVQLMTAKASDDLTRLELGLLGERSEEVFGGLLAGVINQLGAGYAHGQPLGLPASDAARMVSVLRYCPEGWSRRSDAVAAAEQASALLLCDAVEAPLEAEGLAWLQVGDLVE